MTAESIINTVDVLKPNQYTTEQKLAFISELDSHIFEDLIKPYDKDATFTPYVSVNEDVIADARNKDMYVYYVMSMIDFNNAEYDIMNNDILLYNNAYAEYERFFIRNHKASAKGWTL